MSGSKTEISYPTELNWDLSGGQALQLVRMEDGRFEIEQEALEFFQRREKGIAICSLVGKFRSGKSFLMNKLMNLKPKKGFIVSPSVSACTRGLWLWSKPLVIEQQNLEIFFMDSEGLDSPGKDLSSDAKLFALVVMLSSFFMFNSNGYIDEPSIESLSMITHIINNVAVAEEDDIDPQQSMYHLSQYAPSFLWVLRNVVLELQDLRGRPATPAMYLESSLTDIPHWGGNTRNYEKSLEIRRAILNFFKFRDCVALVRPHKDERVLQKLQDVPDTSLQPQFIDSIMQIRQKILAGCHQKVIDGVPFTGSRMIIFLNEFVSSFNAQKKSLVSTAWRALLEGECEATLRITEKQYSEDTSNFLSGFTEGVDPQQLHEQRQIIRSRAIETFSVISYVETRDEQLFTLYQERLQKVLSELDGKIDKINEELCLQRCTDILENSLYEFISDPQFEGKSEYAIIEQFAQKHLLPYLTTTPKVYNTKALVSKAPELMRKLLESYSKFNENEAKIRTREIERSQLNLEEQLRAEEKTSNAYQDVVSALENELVLLRKKLSELQGGTELDQQAPKIQSEFEKMKKQNELSEVQMKEIGNKISDVRSRIDANGKKRWGFCG